MSEPSLDQLYATARRISDKLHASGDQRVIEQDNKHRAMCDRFERGLSPWGAQGSRYEPTEETDDP